MTREDRNKIRQDRITARKQASASRPRPVQPPVQKQPPKKGCGC